MKKWTCLLLVAMICLLAMPAYAASQISCPKVSLSTDDGVSLSWSQPGANAEKYQVKVYCDGELTYKAVLGGDVTSCTLPDSAVNCGGKYTVKLSAKRGNRVVTTSKTFSLGNDNSDCTTGNCPTATACPSGNCPTATACPSGNCPTATTCPSGSCPNVTAAPATSAPAVTAAPTSTWVCPNQKTPKPTAAPTAVATATAAPVTTSKPTAVPTVKPTTAPTASQGSSLSSLAAEVVRQVNEERAAAGLGALTVDSDLTAAACVRAKEIVVSFSHTRPDGSSCFTVSNKAFGENIAMGYSSADKVMAAWMSSSGHKANILRSSFGSIGVCAYSVNGVVYWAQEFGK